MSRIPFTKVTDTVEPGFITPRPKNPKTGRVDTIPDSAANAAVVESPMAVDLAQVRQNTPSKDPAQRALLPALEAAKGGRKRKSKKSKRKTRKSRRRYTRRR